MKKSLYFFTTFLTIYFSLQFDSGNFLHGKTSKKEIILKQLASASTPTGLTVTALSWKQASLNWTDNSNDESGFTIERSGDGVSFTQIGTTLPNKVSYLDTTLVAETTYYYRVKAAGTNPVSDYSDVVSVTTPKPDFVKRYASVIAQTSGTSNAWGDYDLDGDLDLLVVRDGKTNQLFKNDGNGIFTEQDMTGTFVANRQSYAGMWFDANGDGFLDIFVANANNEKNELYLNQGNSTFISITSGPLVIDALNGANTVACNAGDLDQDGDMDVVIVDLISGAFVYYNDGTGNFMAAQPIESAFLLQTPYIADFNNDRLPDLFITSLFSQNNFKYINSAGTFNKELTGVINSESMDSYGASLGDFDNNGFPDIYVCNENSSNNRLFSNNNGTFTEILAGAPIVNEGPSKGAGWGDYNNDGYLDLFVTNGLSNTNNSLYLNNQDGTFTKVLIGEVVNSSNDSGSCSWVDIDNDGDLDLYVTNNSEKNQIFENLTGNTNNWISISLQGTISNKLGIGAKVRLEADINGGGSVTQMREIYAQTGFASQGEMRAHFGLGSATIVNSITIEWPSGITQVHENIAINQIHTIIETEAPAIPADLQAVATSSTTIDLSWTDNSNETSYVIERSVGDDSNYAVLTSPAANSTSYQDGGLNSSTTYFYRIKAINESGESTFSTQVSATTSGSAINAPGDLSLTVSGTSQIDLSWTNNATNATNIVIERSSPDNSSFSEIATIAASENTYADQGLTENTTYFYKIKATNTASESGYSAEVSATTQALAPAAPSDLAASAASSTQINLSWTNNATSATNILIERSSPDNASFTVINTIAASETTYEDQGVIENTTYFYRIKATNSLTESTYSGEQSATTPISPITAPSDLGVVAASSNQIDLSWTNNAINATNIVIERSSPDNSSFTEITTIAATETTYEEQGVTENTAYFYRIKATNSLTESAYSGEQSATTPISPITAPSDLAASAANSTQINLNWTNNATNATNIVIERSSPDNSSFTEITTIAATETTYEDQGVTENTAYFYRIKATNSLTESAYSGEQSATTPISPIMAPSDLAVSATSSTQIDLSWTNNAINATNIVIERSSPDNSSFTEIANIAATESTYEDQGVTENTTYFYKIKATNTSAESGYSAETSATTLINPIATPTGLITTSAGTDIINLSWTNNATNATNIIIERSSPDNSNYVALTTLTATENTYSDQNLTHNTIYHYRVKAVNTFTESPYSNESNVATQEMTVNAPGLLVATANGTDRIELSWNDLSNNEDEFVIERSLSSGSGFSEIIRLAANSTSYSDQGLTTATQYYYRVKALNQYVESGYSNEVMAVTQNDPVMLSLPQLTVEPGTTISMDLTVINFTDILSNQFSINWDPAILSFVSYSNQALTGMAFGNSDVSSGELTYSWDDLSSTPQTLSDGSVLFSIEFDVIGISGTSSYVDITGTPLSVEITDQDLNAINVNLNHGQVNSQDLIQFSGRIAAMNHSPIEGAIIKVAGDQNQSVNSIADGSYSTNLLPTGQVSLSVEKTNDTNPNNGVSTLDIALLRRDLLNMMPLQNNYQYVAADVNASGDLTTIDIAMIRRVVLGIENTFDEGLWRFISTFADPTNPYSYQQSYDLSPIQDQTDLDFTAVRLGDINGSWNAANGRLKSPQQVEFHLDEMIVRKESNFTIPLRVADFKDIAGYQFTIQWNTQLLEFQGLTQMALEGSFNLENTSQGLITTSWDHETGTSTSLGDQEIIAELEFKVKGSPGQIAEVALNSAITSQLAFNQNLEELNFKSTPGKVKISADGFHFYQDQLLPVYPNPFGQSTTIPFELADDGQVKLMLFNALGEIVWTQERYFNAGKNQFEWKPDVDTPAGTYYCRLETANIKAGIKMLYIK